MATSKAGDGADGEVRRPPEALERFASGLFAAASMEADKAESMARLLVPTDTMGRRTHGLARCASYLDEIARGTVTTAGEPEVLRDTGATPAWDGRYLPGLWLVERAVALGLERLPEHGVVAVVPRRSHHIGCLAALAKGATDRGCIALLASSGPHGRIVAPFGGKGALFGPDPFAFGFPAGSLPVSGDISASITTVSMTRQKADAGEAFEHP